MRTDPATLLRAHKASVGAAGAVLLLVGLVLAQQAWTEPVHERLVHERGRWTEASSFAYRVPITRNASLWPGETTLPMGQPAYYRTVTDHVPVTFEWRAEGAEGLAEATLKILIRGQNARGDVFWQIEHPLADGLTRDPTSGLRLDGVLRLDDLVGEATLTTQHFPLSEGRINWSVVASVTYALDAAGGPRAGTAEYVLPMEVNDPRFVLPGPEALQWRRPHADVETRTLTHPAGREGLLSSLRAQAFLLGGVALVASAAWAHRTDPERGLGPRDVAFRREHERHRDWITTLSAPVDETRLPAPVLDVPTLEDLVHAAADARVRILLDPMRRVYYALAPTGTYRYAGHALPFAPPPRAARPRARARARR